MSSNYPFGFKGGVTIRGIPLSLTHPGEVFWVNNSGVLAKRGVGGSDGNDGSYHKPFASIDYAVSQCTANRGDVVMVMPGHTETVAAAGDLDLDVAGVALIGLGSGSLRPTVDFTTATTADMDVTAANITMVNFQFTGNVDALVAPIHIAAAHFSMIDCETRDVTGQAVDFILAVGAADNLYIEGWVHRGDTASGASTAFSMYDADNATIIPKFIDGNFGTAAIENVSSAASNMQVFGSANYPAYIRTRNSADVIVKALATTTGRVGPFINARLADDAANITEAFVGADMEFFQPINIVNADGESSMETNITASTDA